MKRGVVAALAALTVALPAGCGEDEEPRAETCASVSVGDGNRAVRVRPDGIDCHAAHRIARASQDQTEPDYVIDGFHCMGRIETGPNERIRRVVYRCERDDDAIRFSVIVG